MLWGMSEVNAWLLYRRFKHGTSDISFTRFRRMLYKQLLEHPKWVDHQRVTRSQATTCHGKHLLLPIPQPEGVVSQVYRRCTDCGQRTHFYCGCLAYDMSTTIYICPPNLRPECMANHLQGLQPIIRRSLGQQERWKKHIRE